MEIIGKVVRTNKGEFLKFFIYNKNKGPREISVILGKDDDFALGCEGALVPYMNFLYWMEKKLIMK